jgi:hypothetical protein
VRREAEVALASFAAAASSVIADDAGPATLLGLTVIYFLYGAVFGIPGTIVWMLVVAILPPEGRRSGGEPSPLRSVR